jgi:hypothetical protein
MLIAPTTIKRAPARAALEAVAGTADKGRKTGSEAD